jgi:hypothetical protein
MYSQARKLLFKIKYGFGFDLYVKSEYYFSPLAKGLRPKDGEAM